MNLEYLRCHSRYSNADIDEETKHPKLLPRNNYFTRLLKLEVHEWIAHARIVHILNQLRQEYWVLLGWSEVSHIIYKCVVCRCHQGSPFCLPLIPWPKEIVSASNLFTYVGLGPLQVKQRNPTQKMWICLVTCVAVWAVNLSWLKDCLLLDCLRRFIARRSKPTTNISDNVPKFHMVKTALDQQWMEVYKSIEFLLLWWNWMKIYHRIITMAGRILWTLSEYC